MILGGVSDDVTNKIDEVELYLEDTNSMLEEVNSHLEGISGKVDEANMLLSELQSSEGDSVSSVVPDNGV